MRPSRARSSSLRSPLSWSTSSPTWCMPMSIPASGTTEAVAAPDAPELAERRPDGVVRGLLRHRSARVGFAILGLYTVGTILGPLIFHSNPSNNFDYQSLQDAFLKPSAAHLLGTD